MKKFEQYWNEERQVFEYNGVEFGTFDEVIQSVLGWCMCGCPDDSQRMIMKALRHIKNLQELVWENKMEYEVWAKNCRDLFGEWEYVIYYILYEKKLTEHGGSVPGWLTDEGIELLELLESFYENRDV